MTVIGARDLWAILDVSLTLYVKLVAPRTAADVSMEEYRLWLDGQIDAKKLPLHEKYVAEQRWRIERCAATAMGVVDKFRELTELLEPMRTALEEEALRATQRAIAQRPKPKGETGG